MLRRDLHLLATAVFLSAVGDFLALITLALEVHDRTGDGLLVAAFFAATMVPVVVLAPAAGLIADRVESVRVLVAASLVQALVAIALAYSHSSLAAILALTALLSAGSAVSAPAEFALVGALAGSPERLLRANGVMEAARYAGFAAGPLLAAGLAALAGTREALLVNALSFLAIAVAAALMRARRPPVEHHPGERARDGLAHLFGDRVLRASVIAAIAALACVSATITAEVFYVKDVLGAGDSGYAIVTAVWMAAMVAGATRVARRVPREAIAAAALVALGVQGAAIAGQTAWAILPVAIAGYAIGGLAHGAKNTLLRVLIGGRVPERLHGRAFAAYNALRNSAELAALGAGGLLVSGLGARTALLVAGLGPVVAAAGGLLALRGRRPRVAAGGRAGVLRAAGEQQP